MKKNTYYTYISLKNNDIFVGTLDISDTIYDHIITFKYSSDWLNYENAFPLDNELTLDNKLHKSSQIFKNFNSACVTAYNDFSNNMLYIYLLKHNLLSSDEYISVESLYSSLQKGTWSFGTVKFANYFNLINDTTRSGALRFKLQKNGEFISHIDNSLILKTNELAKMNTIIQNTINNTETKEELKILQAGTFGLKGRFPKFNVYDENNNLYIAKIYDKENKFFSCNYIYETFAIDLSKKCNNNPIEYKVVNVNDVVYLLLKRYDRNGSERIHTQSLKSLVQPFYPNDYKKISNCIKYMCKNNKKENLKLYFQRFLFRIIISDHLEYAVNTEFIFDDETSHFKLSPDLDLSVAPQNTSRHSKTKKQLLLRTKKYLKSTIKNSHYFNLNKPKVKHILNKINSVLRNWKVEAKNYGFSDEEIDKMLIFNQIIKFF